MILPDYIKNITYLLEKNNIECYVVGGCVRDHLIGSKPSDYDMCASSLPDVTTKILSEKYTVIPTGIEHGTITVITEESNVEITTFRMETGYSDFRHPDAVIFTDDIKKDLARRDFTINAMAYNDKTGIIDIFDGKKDLKNKIIRTVGNADRRFNEDALRMLRALRFSSQLDFKIEKETSDSIIKNFDLINNIAGERIYAETCKLLNGSCNVLFEYQNILNKIYGDYDLESIRYIAKTKNLDLKFYFLFTNQSESERNKYISALKLPSSTRKNINMLFKYDDIKIENITDVKKIICTFGKDNSILIFEKNDILYNTKYKITAENLLSDSNCCLSLRQLNINGNDVKALGYSGKDIGKILNHLLLLVVENKIPNDKNKLLKTVELLTDL